LWQVPVLLGLLLRIATGILADRFEGRAVFALLMIIVAVPAYVASHGVGSGYV
jgi:nitrate/nitrite transporter NarK